jgi:hypothetical protein
MADTRSGVSTQSSRLGAWREAWPFMIALLLVVAVKLALVSDLSLLVQYAPHDDTLYVMRAYHLLMGEGFGPYDARVLAKNPGLSFFIAATRFFGIPFILAVNLIYIAASAYLAWAALRCAFPRWLVFVAFALYLLNPLTMGAEWYRVMREPLSSGMFAAVIAAMLHLLIALRERQRILLHAAALCVLIACVRILREEDVLYYAALAAFACAVLWQVRRDPEKSRRMWITAIIVLIAPVLSAGAAMMASRAFISAYYGLPIVHDYGEGEFPKLIAAIRQVESKKDNRMVMVTQEALAKLAVQAPSFRPVIERLPRPASNTYSCRRYGVCSEWGNGWMLWWIKDAAYEAGLTPDLVSAQAYFAKVRLEIEQACNEGRLVCHPAGNGLLPTFELRWSRAYIHELLTLIRMTLSPDAHVISDPPTLFDLPPNLALIYQELTMTHRAQTRWGATPSSTTSSFAYKNPLMPSRIALSHIYDALAKWLFIAAFIFMLARASLRSQHVHGPFALTAYVFVVFTGIRLAALAYAAVYFGFFDDRLVYPLYSVMLMLAPLMIADAFQTFLRPSRIGNPEQ